MLKKFYCLMLILFLVVSISNIAYATNAVMELSNSTTFSENTSVVDNTTIDGGVQSNPQQNVGITETTSVDISTEDYDVSNEDLSLSNMINIILIVVGVVLILLGIAIILKIK